MEPACSNDSSKRRLRSNSVTKLVEYDNLPKDSSEEASFIKLLDCDFSKQLQIPQEFTEIFNGNVPRRFLIESAMTKNCWRVEVKEEADKIYLREGWAGFVEGHPLQVGDFLLFEYEEHSIFVVKIYDKNGCRKMTRDVPGGKNNPVKAVDFEEPRDSQAKKYKPKQLGTRSSCQEYTKRLITRKYGKAKYKKHAIPRKRVKAASVSENNMAFSVKIHKYMKFQFQQLFFPQAITHAQKLMNIKEVILGNDIVNRWPVGLSHRKDGRVALCHGWRAFLEDNRVAGGDSLSFEFVRNDLIKVHVTKASQAQQEFEDDNSPSVTTLAQNLDGKNKLYRKHVIPSTPVRAAIRVSENKKKHPILRKKVKAVRVSENNKAFYVKIHKYMKHQFSKQCIPIAIIRAQNLINKKEVILENAMGNQWPVGLSHLKAGKGVISTLYHGWKAFLDGNGVAAGDSLSFEFVSEDLAKVRVTREAQVEEEIEDDHDSQNDTTMDCKNELYRKDVIPSKPVTAAIRVSANEKAFYVKKKKHPISRKRAKAVRVSENNKAFYIKIHKYKKHQFRQLFIPIAIIRAQNLMNKKELILEDTMGNRSPVELSHYRKGHNTGQATLHHGWKAFLDGNGVAAGDSLSFEFVSEDVVKVRVTKESQVEEEIEDDHDSQNEATMDCEPDEINAFTDDVNPPETPIITRRGKKRNSPEPSSSSFSCVWRPTTTGYLYVPKKVTVCQNLMKKDRVVLRDPDGKCWPVELCKQPSGFVSLAKGWIDFWKGQSIKVGESLDFEFVSEHVIQVTINRGKPLKSPIKTEETIINVSETSTDEPRVEPETSMTRAEVDMTWPEPINYYLT